VDGNEGSLTVHSILESALVTISIITLFEQYNNKATRNQHNEQRDKNREKRDRKLFERKRRRRNKKS